MDKITFTEAIPILLFFVPGFILYFMISIFVPQKTRDPKEATILYLCLACLNYGPLIGLLFIFDQGNWATSTETLLGIQRTVWLGLFIFFASFLMPIMLGFLIGKSLSRVPSGWFWQKIGFNPHVLFESAWDYKFNLASNNGEPEFVILHFNDGQILGGIYTNGSFVSTSSSERDLVLSKLCAYEGENTWRVIPGSEGVWIKSQDIVRIEFWDIPKPEKRMVTHVQAPFPTVLKESLQYESSQS